MIDQAIRNENEIVINALVGRPVLWDGGHLRRPDPETDAVARMLQKRTTPATPSVLAKLTGLPLREVQKHLGRLHRAGLAEPVGHGEWAAL